MAADMSQTHAVRYHHLECWADLTNCSHRLSSPSFQSKSASRYTIRSSIQKIWLLVYRAIWLHRVPWSCFPKLTKRVTKISKAGWGRNPTFSKAKCLEYSVQMLPAFVHHRTIDSNSRLEYSFRAAKSLRQIHRTTSWLFLSIGIWAPLPMGPRWMRHR